MKMRRAKLLRLPLLMGTALAIALALWLWLGAWLGRGAELPVAGLPLAPSCKTTVSADVTVHMTWTLALSPYCVAPGVDVVQGITLTVQPGVTAYFLSATSGLTVSGNLVALGTSAQPIAFTSYQSSPQPGDWMGLTVRSGGRARLDYVDIAYAGYGKRTAWYHSGCTNPDYLPLPGDGAGALWVEDYAPMPTYPDLELRHSRIHHNRGSGVVFHGSSCDGCGSAGGWIAALEATQIDHNTGAAICEDGDALSEQYRFPSYAGLTFTGNGADALVLAYRYAYYQNRSLDGPVAFNGSPIHLINGGGISMRDDKVLTLLPGTTMLFTPLAAGAAGGGSLFGRLTAEGTAEQPITFTSGALTPQPGDWAGLELSHSSLAYCRISYAGSPGTGAWGHAALRVNYDVTVRRCDLHDNDAGIQVNTQLIDHFSRIEENDVHGNRIGMQLSSAPVLRGNRIHGNRDYGLIALTEVLQVDARYTWWGHPTGPYHPLTNPSGLGDRIEDYYYQGYQVFPVLYSPWATTSVEGSPPLLAALAPTSGATLTALPQRFQMRAADPDLDQPLYFRLNIYAGYALVHSYDQQADPSGWDRAIYFPGPEGAVTVTLSLLDPLPNGDYAWEATVFDGWHTVTTPRQPFRVSFSGWGIAGITPSEPIAIPSTQRLTLSGAGFASDALVWLEQARYDGTVTRLTPSYRKVVSTQRIEFDVNLIGRSGPWEVVVSQAGQTQRATLYVLPYLTMVSFDYINDPQFVMNHVTAHTIHLFSHGTAPGVALVGVIAPTGTLALLPNNPVAGVEYVAQIDDRTHIYAIHIRAGESRYDTLYWELPQTAVNLPGDPIDPTKWDWGDPLRFKAWVIAQPTEPGWQVLRQDTTTIEELLDGAIFGSAFIEGWAHDQYAELLDESAAAEYLERLGAQYPLVADALLARQIQDWQLVTAAALGIEDETLESAALSGALAVQEETFGEFVRRQIGDPWSFTKGFLLQANEDGIPWDSHETGYDRGTLLVAEVENLIGDTLFLGFWKPKIGYWNYTHINGEEQGLVEIGHTLGTALSIPMGFGLQEAAPKGAINMIRKASDRLRPGGDRYFWKHFKLTVEGNETEPARLGLSVLWKGGDDWVSREVGRDYNLIHWGDNPTFGGSHWGIGWTRNAVVVNDMVQYGARYEVLFGSGLHLYTNHMFIPYKYGGKMIGELSIEEMRALLGTAYEAPIALWRSGTAPELLPFPANFADATACYDGSATLAASWDPNDITGIPIATHIRSTQPLEFLVRFENIGTIPAETVTVTLPIHADLAWDSMTLLGSSAPETVTVKADALDRALVWAFDGINLPPNTAPPEGEGWVRVRISPSMPLTTGQQITAQASIVFDQNDPIMTNIVTYTIDLHPPEPSLSAAGYAGPFPLLRLTGIDNAGGSGTTHVGLFYSRDGVTWTGGPVVMAETTTELLSGLVTFAAGGGHYWLRAAAVDRVGNVSPLSSAEIEVDIPLAHGVYLPLSLRNAR